MQKMTRRVLALAVVAELCACAAAPSAPAPNLAPDVAVENAVARQFDAPSYRFHINARVSDASYAGDATAAAVPGQNTQAEAAARFMAENEKPFDELAGVLLERTGLDIDGVIDQRHGQLELVPALNYKATNAGFYMRMPMLFDLAAGKGYVDLSATSPVLVNPGADGKYSVFSLQPFTDHVDAEKLLQWWRDLSLDVLAGFGPEQFRDQPLTAADSAAGAGRKIEVSLSFADWMRACTAAQTNRQSEFRAALRDTDDKPVAGLAGSPGTTDMLLGILRRFAEPKSAPNAPELVRELQGTVRYDYLIDHAGNLIATHVHADWRMPRMALNVGSDIDLRYSDYGSAHVSFRPTADNTVPYEDSHKGSVVEELSTLDENRKRELATAHPNLTPPRLHGNNPFVGHWQYRGADQCAVDYYVPDNFRALLTCGRRAASLTYQLSGEADQQGFFSMSYRSVLDNRLPDCSGKIAAGTARTTSFLQFNPARTVARLCDAETLDHCVELTRVPDDTPDPGKADADKTKP